MVNDQATFFSAKYSEDYTITGVVDLNLVDKILFIVKPDITIFECNEKVVRCSCSVHGQLRH